MSNREGSVQGNLTLGPREPRLPHPKPRTPSLTLPPLESGYL